MSKGSCANCTGGGCARAQQISAGFMAPDGEADAPRPPEDPAMAHRTTNGAPLQEGVGAGLRVAAEVF